jgi:tRNA U55 pseudouridine synthase TruB
MEAIALATKPSPDKHEEADWVRNRFFHIKTSGGQSAYFDSVTGDQNLQHQHIVYQLMERGNTFERSNEITTNVHCRPIILSPVYRPAQPEVVNVDGNLYPNVWRKPTIQPLNVDAAPFKQHLIKMLGSAEKAEYLIRMLSYRYQTPNIQSKPHIAFYFYGLVGGYGKSLFATTLEKVFGETAVMTVMDQTALESMSSVDMWTRTWTIVQEVDVKRGSTNINKIKTMTGGNNFAAARKGEHFKKHETPAQLIMLSNDAPHFLEPNDRRFFVSQWQCEFDTPADKDTYFNDYTDWLENHDGYAAIAQLLNTTDISSVNIAAPAMMTQEKEAVISMGTDECVSAIQDFIEANPSQLLFTREDFEDCFTEHNVEAKAEKYKMEAAGLTKQSSIKIDGKRHYFWCSQGSRIVSQRGVEAYLVSSQGNRSSVKEALETRRKAGLELEAFL